jgi:hypothetical protein
MQHGNEPQVNCVFHRGQTMTFEILVLFSAITAPPAATPDHAKYKEVFAKWQCIHELEGQSANAQLVIDPRERAIWIENDGTIHREHGFADLPEGFEWSAFHITNRGIVECSFPVRLARPSIKNDSGSEELWIIGASKSQGWQFSFSSNTPARGYHIGSGSPIKTLTFRQPPHSVTSNADPASLRSFLVPQTPRTRESKESIQAKHFSIHIVRESNP